MAMRFLHGSVGGMLVGVAYAVFARTRTPDRVFGMLLVIQYGLGGLGIMLLPRLGADLRPRRAVRRADRLQLRHAADAAVPRCLSARAASSGRRQLAASAGACWRRRSPRYSCSRPATWGSRRTCWGSRAIRTRRGYREHGSRRRHLDRHRRLGARRRIRHALRPRMAARSRRVLTIARNARFSLECVAARYTSRQLPDRDHLVVRDRLPARACARPSTRPAAPRRSAASVQGGARLGPVRCRLAARVADYGTLVNVSASCSR